MTTTEFDPIGTEARFAALERHAVQEAVTRVFVRCDRRDWSALPEVLGDPVAVDYTSLNGGEPAVVGRDDLVEAWRGALGGFDTTHHLLGSFLIDDLTRDSASIRFYAIATHVLRAAGENPVWTVAGHYDAAVHRASAGWQLAALTLHTDWITGNQQLPTLAAATRGDDQ
jgi:hypothetical protein